MTLPAAPPTLATDAGRRASLSVVIQASGWIEGPGPQGKLPALELNAAVGSALDWAGVLHGLMVTDLGIAPDQIVGSGTSGTGLTITTTTGNIEIDAAIGDHVRIGDANLYTLIDSGAEQVIMHAGDAAGLLTLRVQGGANGDASIVLDRDVGRVTLTGAQAAPHAGTGLRWAYPSAAPRRIILDLDLLGGGWTLYTTASGQGPLEIRQLGTGAFTLTGGVVVANAAYVGPGTIRAVRALAQSFRETDADAAGSVRYKAVALSAIFDTTGTGTGNTQVRLIAKPRGGGPEFAMLSVATGGAGVTVTDNNSGTPIDLDLANNAYQVEVWDNTIGTAGSGTNTDEIGRVWLELEAYDVGA